jgi:hypothetical protein
MHNTERMKAKRKYHKKGGRFHFYVQREDDSTTTANHEGAWKCPTPFFKDDWTHRFKQNKSSMLR